MEEVTIAVEMNTIQAFTLKNIEFLTKYWFTHFSYKEQIYKQTDKNPERIIVLNV